MWSRDADSLTIEIETRYSQNVEKPSNCGSECQLLYTMGDETSYLAYTTSPSLVSTYTDVNDEPYDVLEYKGYHTYETAKRYEVGVNTCCRVASLNVRDIASHLVKFHIDLSQDWNVGSPVVAGPMTLQVPPGALFSYKIPIALNSADIENGGSVVCTNSWPAASGINKQVTTDVDEVAPYTLREEGTSWFLDFDASCAACGEGGRFALQFRVSDGPSGDAESRDTVIVDMVVELVSNADSPVVEPASLGLLNCLNTQTKKQTFTVTDTSAGALKMTYTATGSGKDQGWWSITVNGAEAVKDETYASGSEFEVSMQPNAEAHADKQVFIDFIFINTAGKQVTVNQELTVAADVSCDASWTDWSSCSEPCDGGNQTRLYKITTRPSGLGTPCLSAAYEVRDCNTPECGFTCETTDGPEGCKTCRDQDVATADGQCGTCHKKYGVNLETYECQELLCLGKGTQETWIGDDKFSQCRTCKHDFQNNPNDPEDLSCGCNSIDTRALVQPEAAKLIMDDSGASFYTQLDQGIVSIVFEESTAIHRTGKFGPDDFVIYSDENDDADWESCKNAFTWDLNPGDPTDRTEGDCPERRVWHGQVELTTLMGLCGVTIPPNEEAVDNELVVKVRFGVVGQRSIRLEDDAAGSLTETYIWQQVQTMLPLLYYFPLSVEVESPPAQIFNAASKTVIRVTFDADVEDDYPAYEDLCEALKEKAEKVFPSAEKGKTSCKFVLGNQADATTPVDREWGHVTIELYAPEGKLIDTVMENGECDEFRGELETDGVPMVTWDQDFVSEGGTRATEFSCGPVSELFAVRAISEVKVWLQDSTRPDPMVEIALYTAIDAPFELGGAVAPWQDTRFTFEWQAQTQECASADGECERTWVLFMFDENGVCTFDGTYQVRFPVKCRASASGEDASGRPFQCPVQPNYQEGGAPFVTVTFEIQSGEHCPKIGGQVYLDAAMFSYRFDPKDQILGGKDDQDDDKTQTFLGAYKNAKKPKGADEDPIELPELEFHAFINNQRMYFRAQVRSDEAALSVAYFTTINIVLLDENLEEKTDAGAITQIYGDQANTDSGEALGLTVFTANDVHPGTSDPKEDCRVVDTPDAENCWLLPSFSMQADVAAKNDEGKLVLPVDRRSSANFKFTGTIAVQYVAGNIGVPGGRRLLHFVSPGQARRLAETEPDQTAETSATFGFDPTQDIKDTDQSTSEDTSTQDKSDTTQEYSAGFKSSLSGVACASMVVLCLLL